MSPRVAALVRMYQTFHDYNLQLTNDGHVGSKRFVDHQSQDTHLGGTAVVKFNSTLVQLLLFREAIPSKVDPSVTVVTDEFVAGSFNVSHEALQEGHGGDHIRGQTSGHDIKGSQTRRNVGVRNTVEFTREVDSRAGDDLTSKGQHGHTSVNDFDFTEEFELFSVAFDHDTHGIPESQRNLGTNLISELRSRQGRSGGLAGGRGESRGSGDQSGENSSLHG
mmetsp:Transcript_17437/g.36119  ORF Transcript_17437/g.36119 Transcript_17437/m.36119 type:complete len:221 (-) Transcript_17437:13-675(-)